MLYIHIIHDTYLDNYFSFGHGPGIHALRDFIDVQNYFEPQKKKHQNLNLHVPMHGPCVDCHIKLFVNLLENNNEELRFLKLWIIYPAMLINHD